jgi:hypothetical protein
VMRGMNRKQTKYTLTSAHRVTEYSLFCLFYKPYSLIIILFVVQRAILLVYVELDALRGRVAQVLHLRV